MCFSSVCLRGRDETMKTQEYFSCVFFVTEIGFGLFIFVSWTSIWEYIIVIVRYV